MMFMLFNEGKSGYVLGTNGRDALAQRCYSAGSVKYTILSIVHNYPACACASRGLCDLGWCPYICMYVCMYVCR